MANGTITLTKHGSGNVEARLRWSSQSNGTAANTSTVTAILELKRPSGYYASGTWKGELKVGSHTQNIDIFLKIPDILK